MDFNEYQEFAKQGVLPQTANAEHPIVGFALGLAGESGEVADDIKKVYFHGRDIPIPHTAEELGDVMWYVANIATQLGYKLSDIVDNNVNKLHARYPNMYKEVQHGQR